VELNLRKTQAELEFLTSRYEVASRKWTPADKKQYQLLKRKEKRLQDLVSSRTSAASGVTDWFSKIWNALAPLRIVVGLAFLGLSFLIVVSYVLSAIDRAMHSECKFACGFTLSTPNVMNPIDMALTRFSKVFPLDYIVFGGLTAYIFLCSIAGLVSVGVRLLCWKLYDIEKRKSMPHGLIMGAWLLMFVVLLMNMELLTLAPRYVSFGNQFYLDETGERHDCDMAHAGFNANGTLPSVCTLSQVASFVSSTTLALPFFGVIFYIANYVFFATFLVSVVYVIFRSPRKAEYQQMHGGDEEY
jgi:LMBR1 domain-containing protein 1